MVNRPPTHEIPDSPGLGPSLTAKALGMDSGLRRNDKSATRF
jgi:hypothetical protein